MSSATSNTSFGFCSTSTIDKPLSFSLRIVAITSALPSEGKTTTALAFARTLAVNGQHTLLIGQSGVGKSTLVNALVPDASARIGVISDALHGGRHTTTSTSLYRVPGGDGWLVDLQIDGSSLEDALRGLLDADGYRATVTE